MRNFMSSISGKILFGYAGILLITAVTAMFLMQSSRGVQVRVGAFIDTTIPQLAALEQLGGAINRLEISAFSLYGTTTSLQEFDESRNDQQLRIDQQFQLVSQLPLNKLKASLQSLNDSLDALRRVMAAGSVDWDGARDELGRLSNYANQAHVELGVINEAVADSAETSSRIISQELSSSVVWVIALVAVIIGFALFAYYLSRRQVAIPIARLSQKMEQVAQDHDLTQVLSAPSRDEVGLVADSINHLLKVFREGMSDVSSAIRGISGAVSSMAHATETSDTSVAQLGQEIDQLVSVMLRLEDNIEQSVRSSEVASEIAQRGASEVQQGASEVANTSDSIAVLAADIETTAAQLSQLRTAGDQVSGVVSTIAEIADQTNLLALNAAIEAARAGESGRGFAVVADEVRTLATKTHQSTVEINSMLDNIVSSISRSVDTMASNQEKAQQSVGLAQTTVESLSEIKHTILELSRESSEAARLTAGARQEVGAVREQVNEFKRLGDMVVDGSKETREAAADLGQLSVSLDQLVDKFKV
jgi:methyl-accepting chemotaxis protein